MTIGKNANSSKVDCARIQQIRHHIPRHKTECPFRWKIFEKSQSQYDQTRKLQLPTKTTIRFKLEIWISLHCRCCASAGYGGGRLQWLTITNVAMFFFSSTPLAMDAYISLHQPSSGSTQAPLPSSADFGLPALPLCNSRRHYRNAST